MQLFKYFFAQNFSRYLNIWWKASFVGLCVILFLADQDVVLKVLSVAFALPLSISIYTDLNSLGYSSDSRFMIHAIFGIGSVTSGILILLARPYYGTLAATIGQTILNVTVLAVLNLWIMRTHSQRKTAL
jgi:hypothetical protein